MFNAHKHTMGLFGCSTRSSLARPSLGYEMQACWKQSGTKDSFDKMDFKKNILKGRKLEILGIQNEKNKQSRSTRKGVWLFKAVLQTSTSTKSTKCASY